MIEPLSAEAGRHRLERHVAHVRRPRQRDHMQVAPMPEDERSDR